MAEVEVIAEFGRGEWSSTELQAQEMEWQASLWYNLTAWASMKTQPQTHEAFRFQKSNCWALKCFTKFIQVPVIHLSEVALSFQVYASEYGSGVRLLPSGIILSGFYLLMNWNDKSVSLEMLYELNEMILIEHTKT